MIKAFFLSKNLNKIEDRIGNSNMDVVVVWGGVRD